MTGKCKWFDARKGYGFITDDQTGREYFVHHTKISQNGYRYLDTDDPVCFELEATDRGLIAVQVEKMG